MSSLPFSKFNHYLRFYKIFSPIFKKTLYATSFISFEKPYSSDTENCYREKDPAPYFFDKRVRFILKKLTGFDVKKIFTLRNYEYKRNFDNYVFLSKDDYEKKTEEALARARRLLSMPPIVKEREPINEVLSKDPALQGLMLTRIVFADISFKVSDKKRLIVVREPNGTLRKANWDERDRMNQIYNPKDGRYFKDPEAFQDENLKDVLNRGEYIFILDFAASHFEPDNPLYQKSVIETYDHIKSHSKYDVLFSTRHYGPMCFYYAWSKKIDDLLVYYIHQDRLEEGASLTQLYYSIHNEQNLPNEEEEEEEEKDHLGYIKKYMEEDSKFKGNISIALKIYAEKIRERQELEKAEVLQEQ